MRIVCYGDSNTWGHNPKNGNRFGETRWPRLLQKMCPDDTIIEEGLCGRCAAFIDSVKPYRHGLSSLRMVLETQQPFDMVILMLGTNDCKACFTPNAVAISNGIKEMVHIIQNKAIYNASMEVPQILIIAPPHLKEGYQEIPRINEQFNENSFEVSLKLAAHYEEIAEQHHCLFLDASQYAEASGIDGVHMDEENHDRMAQAIYSILNKKDDK